MNGSRLRQMLSRAGHALLDATRRYFAAGLLAFAPIAITLWAMAWIIQRLDNLLLPNLIELLLPANSGPVQTPPLVGALFTFVVILLAGVVARHFFGNQLIRTWERLLARVPVARSIYNGVKQLFEAIFTQDQRSSFNRVVLVEYPRRGLYALAFTTGAARGPVQAAVPESLVNCFVPTTPNPTSGFYLLAREEELIDVALSVEEAFKVIMSAGLVVPENQVPPAPPEIVATTQTPSSQ